MEGGDEKPGEKQDNEAKSDLCGDQHIHGAAFVVRLLIAFECGDRLDGRSAQGWCQSEKKRDHQREQQAEDQDSPVCGEEEVRRIVGRVDAADDKRRRPPGENCPQCGREKRQHGILHQDELYQAPATGSDRDAEGHLRVRGMRLARSSGWPRWRRRSTAPEQPGCQARPERGGNRSASWRHRKRLARSGSSFAGTLRCRVLTCRQTHGLARSQSAGRSHPALPAAARWRRLD